MTAEQQYEEFDAWLTDKYREVLRAWDKEFDAGRVGSAVEEAYDELLKRICVEIKWSRRRGRGNAARRHETARG